MTVKTFLKLGRVSNLPTVWTNALAGAVLAGQPTAGPFLTIGAALTLFYMGGMWLNDAFDARIDARERADRPIPRGEISKRAVSAGGFALLGAGAGLAFLTGATAGVAGLGLAAVVLLYDWLHKRTVFSPVIMGSARFFCYILAAVAVGQITGLVLWGALGLLAYTAGLTYAAKQEAFDRLDRAWPLAVLAAPLIYSLTQAAGAAAPVVLWAGFLAVVLLALRLLIRRARGDVPRAVVTLIAGMSLYDAVLIAGMGELSLAGLAVAGFALTLVLQRVVPGT